MTKDTTDEPVHEFSAPELYLERRKNEILTALESLRDQFKWERFLLSSLQLPFGKYEGVQLDDVPLIYLDQTIAGMPDSWISIATRRYLYLTGYLNLGAYDIDWRKSICDQPNIDAFMHPG